MKTGLVSMGALIVIGLAAVGCGYSGPTIEAGALKKALDDGSRDMKVIDVRPAVQYKTGHIKGALNYPLESLDSKMEAIGRLEGEVMIICTCGKRSLAAIKKLAEKGLTATLVLGGHKKWAALGFPVVKGE
jgi:rhodanese-related sulfurtransferase